ncbi:Response regulator receiver domain-containing protein [Butyrivibrio fibrisolvens]|uniref:Stage 0 sporulation protein A homolog n=1 Tax=Butyrivibrio fibrisolvens TaxID=831 RepID=A0A1H9VUQ4_BUTFI|nr:helix-turn-helix domain-containing protein [Butyrivibrio fibrisolvens]SES25269.1 Response regulator receiver domain-containing protein [Butyrivibrio fibrisolvens]
MSKRRYKVLAADDEYWSRENIRTLLPWDTYSIDFLEPAQDGEEVLERIPVEKPDIVMTDINMPFMDGLELLNKIHEMYPDIVSVAISGYDDFEKVKGVFLNGGIDYLLKPVGREQMVDVLKKSLEALESKGSDYVVSSFVEDSELSMILSGKLYQAKKQTEISATRNVEHIPSLLLKFHDTSKISQMYQNDMAKMSLGIKNMIREVTFRFENNDNSIVLFNYSTKVNEFIMCSSFGEEVLLEIAKGILDKFSLDEYGPITVVYKAKTQAVADMAKTYRDMITGLMNRPFDKRHAIVNSDKGLVYTKADEGNGPLIYYLRPDSKERKFIRDGGRPVYARTLTRSLEKEIIDAINKESAYALTKCLVEKSGLISCDKDGWTLFEISQYIARLGGIIWGMDNLPKAAYENREEIENGIGYAQMMLDKESLLDNIKLAVSMICEDNGASVDTSIMGQVEQIHDLLLKRYYEHFTLSHLGEQYHVDPTYLSRVFSQRYGESITAFIARIRIEKAIELMIRKQSFEAISFEVGYEDYNYFSRVFRKQTGMSPSEYKKKLEESHI